MFICYTDWATQEVQAVGKDWKPSVCIWVCVNPLSNTHTHTHTYTHTYTHIHRQVGNSTHTFCQSVIRRNAHLVFHVRLSYATHCFFNLTQQEATADTVTPLSTLSLSITHTPWRSHWQLSPLSVFPLTIPPAFLPSAETRSDYPPLFPRQTHQQIYCRPLSPLCWSLWKRLNALLNGTFFSIRLPFSKIPPSP